MADTLRRASATLVLGWTAATTTAIIAMAAAGAQTQTQAPPLNGEIRQVFWHHAVDGTGLRETASAALLAAAGGRTPPSKELALDFVRQQSAGALQLEGAVPEWTIDRIASDPSGDHVTLQQTYAGLKVFAAQLVVHVAQGAVVAANGEYAVSAAVHAKPLIPSSMAVKYAAQTLAYPNPQVISSSTVIFNPALLDAGDAENHLAHMLVVRDAAMDPDDTFTVFVSAQSGKVLHEFSNLQTARNRETRELNGSTTLPGALCFTEGGRVGTPSPDCVAGFNLAGDTYTYFSTTHSRDSFDNRGGMMSTSVRLGTTANAYWNGSRTVFGPGFATKDVVAHEWGHAVTQHTAGLVYSNQSGALNESFSDIFGAMVDRDDWLLGEDLPGGAIRNMQDPTRFNHPGKVSDPQYFCGTGDNGGVHYNSGVPNHAAFLMSEGATYNGRTITAIGRSTTERIFYRALTSYLTAGSNFSDAFNALNSACADLFGSSSSSCTNARTALQAVEMDQPACAGGGTGTPDSFEDDDAPARASAYISAQNHTFHDAGDADWVRFTVAVGTTVVLQTSALQSRADTVLTLLGTNGTTVLTVDDDSGTGRASRISYTIPAAGTYFARVRQYSSSVFGANTGYTLTVTSSVGTSGADAFEPDNGPAAASTITPNGAAQVHNFHAAGDNDWAKFTAAAGSSYIVETDNLGAGSDTYLMLISTNGTTVLTYNDDSGSGAASRIEWIAPAAGVYFARVRHFSAAASGANTNYELRVRSGATSTGPYEPNDVVAQATALTPGSVQTHGFYRPSDYDWLRFAATAGAPTVVETQNLGSTSDTVVDVYGIDGRTLIDTNDDSNGTLASRVAFTPTLSGVYFARVRHYDGDVAGAATNYDVRVTGGSCSGGDSFEPDNSAATGGDLPANAAARQHTHFCRGDRDWVSFPVTAGGEYVLTTSSLGSAADTILTLYEGDGTTVIASDDDGGGGLASRIPYTATTTGTRRAQVRHYSPTGEGASTAYRLHLAAVVPEAGTDAFEVDNSPAQARSLVPGAAQLGHNFHVAGDNDYQAFSALSGTTYTIETLNLGSRADTVIALFSAANLTTPIATDDDGGGGVASRIVFTAGSSGTHYIRVTHFDASTSGGNTHYDIRLVLGSGGEGSLGDAFERDDSAAAASTITPGTPQRHTFHVGGDQDWARLVANPNTVYIIQTSNLGVAADTVVSVMDPAGITELASDDDGGGARASLLTWSPPSAGTYFVRVRHYSAVAGGAGNTYELTVATGSGGDAYEMDNTAAQASSINVGATQANRNFHVAGDLDWAKFNALVGTDYVIETSNLGPASDTVLDLFDSTGSLVASNDDSGGTLASRVQWTATATATVHIRVRQFLSTVTGPGTRYDLSVLGSSGCSVTDPYEPDNSPSQARTLVAASPQTAHKFGCAGDADWIRMTLAAGWRYRVQTTNLSTSTDTVLHLYMPDAVTELAANDDSNDTLASTVEFTAPVSGTFYARIRQYSASEGGATTSYDVALTELATSAADSYEPDDTSANAKTATSGTAQIVHNFHTTGDLDWIKFSAAAGNTCTMETLNLGSRSDTFLEYFGTNPGGSVVDSNDDGGVGLASRLVRSIMTAGTSTQYVRVRHFSSTTAGAETNYDFRVTCLASSDVEPNDTPSQSTALTIGTAQRHQFGVAGDTDWFRFTAAAGTSYAVETLNLGSSSDTILALYDTDGSTRLRLDDDGGGGLASKVIWVAPTSATYYVQVTHFQADASGPLTAYDVRVRVGTSFAGEPDDESITMRATTEGVRTTLTFTLEEARAHAIKVEVLAKDEYLRFAGAVPTSGGKIAWAAAETLHWQMVSARGAVTAWYAPKAREQSEGIEFTYLVVRPLPGGKMLVPVRLTSIAADGAISVKLVTASIVSAAGEPKIDSVDPTVAPSTGSTIAIRGQNFVDTPKVSLWAGSSTVPLTDVSFTVEGGVVTALLPAGTKPGVYKVRLENPDGRSTQFDQDFTVTSGGQTCSFNVSSSAITMRGVSDTGSVALTTGDACVWAVVSSATWLTVTSATDGTGSATLSFSAAANMSGESRSATLTIGSASVEVTQPRPPTVSLSRQVLRFARTTAGASTGAQQFVVSQDVAGSVNLSATADRCWVRLTQRGGGFAVSIAEGVGCTLPAGDQTSTITVAASGALNSPVQLTAIVSTVPAGTTLPPTGVIDTPVDNSAGITGSVPVTGWALDDVEVSQVRILRDGVAGEPSLVPVGIATFVEGARPDVAALNPNVPRSARAGWGYLLLTNFFPNQGNGTFRLHAYADDAEGNSAYLGSKTITCANATANDPFGAIDTPGQGESVSGTVNNFGWVLSPNGKRADVVGGGTVSVLIDGISVGSPSGWSPRSDITSLFTSYAGANNAVAVYTFDSRNFTNDVHTIAWVVTDNQGVTQGVGSRYFTIANTSSIAGSAGEGAARETIVASAADIDRLPADASPLYVKRGVAPEAQFNAIAADEAGRVIVRVEELDRIELLLDETEQGYLRAAGSLQPLPIGSRFDVATGTFVWQPGVAFVGGYEVVFVRSQGGTPVSRREVLIHLAPKGSGNR